MGNISFLGSLAQFIANGDLTGTDTSQTVIGLQGELRLLQLA